MDELSDNFELTPDQTEKVLQFQDLTGIEDLDRCKQILRQNNWDFEIAVRLTLDGTVGNHAEQPSENNSSPNLRHRPVAGTSTQNNSSGDASAIQTNNNNVEYRRAETRLTVWSFTTRLISFPFAFLYDTLLSILRFALSLIRTDPSRNASVDTTEERNQFIERFRALYGTTHPVFYRGTYNQALDEAKRDLKFLLVYLHCDDHQDTEQFCRTVITSQRFIDFIVDNNLLFWSASVTSAEGFRVSQQLRENSYPFLALIVVKQNRMVVVKKFEEKTTVETLLTQLRISIDDNESGLTAARLERREREMNSMIRREQDLAFEQSLRADQEKERKKAEEKNKKEAEEKAKKEKQLEESRRKERLMQLRDVLVSEIPAEPEPSDPNAVRLVIKLPNGTRLERRFLKTESIRYLYYFVFSNSQSPLNFQIRTNFPPRDLPSRPPQLEQFEFKEDNTVVRVTTEEAPTFEECELGLSAMLFVHDLEA